MLIDINLWYQALATPFGVIIETDDPERAKQRLYALRAKSPDSDLQSLSIITSPDNPKQLWIVKAKPDET
jgi:hypothetical protein